MEKAKNFQDLIVWQKAHSFVLSVYKLTQSFPEKEIYGLTSQFRRAAISIPANIAEGFRKEGRADKVRFMNIAQGSTEECRYYLLLSYDLGYVDTKKLLNQLEEVSRLLYCSRLKNSIICQSASTLCPINSVYEELYAVKRKNS